MASDEQFSLCWNNFHANMSAGFHGLLSRGDLVDVTLAAEGRLLQAHKLVLSVCSPYFQEMFKMNPTQHPIVFLKDVSHSALRDLLQFMYQGEVNVKQEELASFISTAEQLQVKGLTGNQNEESSTPSKPKPTSRPGPRSSQQRQSVMTKLETDLDSKPSSTPVAVKRPNRPSIASNNSSSSQSGPAKRKCVDPLEAGPSGSAKDEFVTIPDEDENNAVAPKMEPEFVNESMWDDDDDGANNEETNFGEDDSNMEMTGFDGSATGDGNITGGGEGGAVGDAQGTLEAARKVADDSQYSSALETSGRGRRKRRVTSPVRVPALPWLPKNSSPEGTIHFKENNQEESTGSHDDGDDSDGSISRTMARAEALINSCKSKQDEPRATASRRRGVRDEGTDVQVTHKPEVLGAILDNCVYLLGQLVTEVEDLKKRSVSNNNGNSGLESTISAAVESHLKLDTRERVTAQNFRQQGHKLTKIAKTTDRTLKTQGDKKVQATARKDCRNCYANKKRTQTTMECKMCPGNPPMCLECFCTLHTCYKN